MSDKEIGKKIFAAIDEDIAYDEKEIKWKKD